MYVGAMVVSTGKQRKWEQRVERKIPQIPEKSANEIDIDKQRYYNYKQSIKALYLSHLIIKWIF